MHGSTTYLADGFGSYGSRSTVMGGSAIVVAANALLEKFRASVADTSTWPSKLSPSATAKPVCRTDVRSRLSIWPRNLRPRLLLPTGSFPIPSSTITYGTAIAHVAVDAKTGKVTLFDYVVVDDVGRAINPMTLHGQMVGAAVQGMGSVFTEEIAYDENGQLLTRLVRRLHASGRNRLSEHCAIARAIPFTQQSPRCKRGRSRRRDSSSGSDCQCSEQRAEISWCASERAAAEPPRIWEMIQAKTDPARLPGGRRSLDRCSALPA